MQPEQKLDRRAFLRRAGQLGAAAVAAPALVSLVGCKKTYGGGDNTKHVACHNIQSLDNHEKTKREELQYTDDSPFGTKKDCANCALFSAPEDDESCGTCNLVPGPISPKGHCSKWVANS